MNNATLTHGADHPPDLATNGVALPPREGPAYLRAEAVGFGELPRVLATDPSMALPCILEIARALCHVRTAGLSLLRPNADGEMMVRWESVSGELAPYEGIDMPRQSSPCGLCLDTGASIVVSQPDRIFAGLITARPLIIEDLIIPLYDTSGVALGTLWLAHHDRWSRFCSDDVRIAEQLAQHVVLALKLQEHARDRDRAVSLLQSHQVAQQNLLARALHREQRLRKQARAAKREARRALALREAMIFEVNHRTQNTLQAAAAFLSLQARATSSVEVRRALLDSRARLHLLAQAHAMLCQNPDSSQIVRMPQLLRTVCDALRNSFGGLHPGVELQVTSDPMSLPVNDAIVIALVANEAVTNAYKHAFPNDGSGEIAVHLEHTHENVLILRVVDTGVGANLTDAKGGIGMKLMRTFTAELHGVLDLARPADSAGTQITLTLDRCSDRGRSRAH